ncbi:MAG: Rieske (2Fe-2S) protein [Planctomycetes bacterium]|nr:Rieske (2Fe-2S) protein [Planctomycetota bacterium]
MPEAGWIDVGAAEELGGCPLQQVSVGRRTVALSCRDGVFGAVSGTCNHVGGPLGEGVLDGDYVVCPWHYWKFHRLTGEGEPGYEDGCRDPVEDGQMVEDQTRQATQGHRRAAAAKRRSAARTRRLDHRDGPPAPAPLILDGDTRSLGLETMRRRGAASEGFYSKMVERMNWMQRTQLTRDPATSW